LFLDETSVPSTTPSLPSASQSRASSRIGDYVVAVLRVRGCLRGSDEEVDMLETWVINLVDGRVVEGWE
jgi:hypothetical protein